jgi:hypothetical protein
MTDQEDRERESRESDKTKFEEAAESEDDEQRRLAERLGNDPILQEEPED